MVAILIVIASAQQVSSKIGTLIVIYICTSCKGVNHVSHAIGIALYSFANYFIIVGVMLFILVHHIQVETSYAEINSNYEGSNHEAAQLLDLHTPEGFIDVNFASMLSLPLL